MSDQERWDEGYERFKELGSTWEEPRGSWGDQWDAWDDYEEEDAWAA